MRPVGEELEQGGRPPGPTDVRGDAESRDRAIHDARVARDRGVVPRLGRQREGRVAVGRETPAVDPGPGEQAPAAGRRLRERERRGGANPGIGNERDRPPAVVRLVQPREAERAPQARARDAVCEHVEGRRVEQQVEGGAFERRAARGYAGVRHLDQGVTLPLCFRLEPQPTDDIIPRELDAVVGELALGARFLRRAGGRALRLEQLELTPVAGVAQRRAAAHAAQAEGRRAVQRAEARVVQLARGRVQVAPNAADRHRAPRPRSRGSLEPARDAELCVVRGAVDVERAPQRARSARPRRRVGELLRDHVHHPADRVRPVQHARRPADDLDPLGESGVDRGAVLVAPRVVFEAAAVVEHQHAGSRKPADHGLPDLPAGAQRANARQRLECMGERNRPLAAQPLLAQRGAREGRGELGRGLARGGHRHGLHEQRRRLERDLEGRGPGRDLVRSGGVADATRDHEVAPRRDVRDDEPPVRAGQGYPV